MLVHEMERNEKKSIEWHLCIYDDGRVTGRKNIWFNAAAPAPAHSASLQYIINASLDIICQIASIECYRY